MKIILGDNQFFGINHFDLEKGSQTKQKFSTVNKIDEFINSSLEIGLDGFMINSNEIGYDLIDGKNYDLNKEIHYSIPYPHKYASMVNENGMLSLLSYLFKNISIVSNFNEIVKLFVTRNLLHLMPLALDLEVPKKLRKGSIVYLQNIVTDLLIGMGREDILIKFIKEVIQKGYKPGIITLNPIILNKILDKVDPKILQDLIVCFNINAEGFNVFPSLKEVESFINDSHPYMLMGMSIFASGASNIPQSIQYIKELNLDYIVFGTSKIENVLHNYELFCQN
ncbi:hypothetical protein QWY93_02030 [Echinicola jeungdonensis]|uniref:Uncharacterized protein n=1 Tax=Echinicola jeungdonensis TaxID=709343 RepID=A0ABV5J2T3_9BACT|nr:hypothetical protein [Echinicola jeungdonensis]MDN3668112.1 hypothetical protein [Echinicola jeungdonensis]